MASLEAYGRLPRLEWLAYVGDASYSVYLVHALILGFSLRLWHHLGWADSALSHTAFIALVLIASIAAASVLYKHVETKIGRRLVGAVNRLQARRSVPARSRPAITPE
jgi:exopolysaccharide production protein ExoZ